MAQITDAARKVLSSLEHGEDFVRITKDNLDRALYLEVATVIEACGAKWNRGRKVHIKQDLWDSALFDDVLFTGEEPPKNPLAFFPTPRSLADDMAKWVMENVSYYNPQSPGVLKLLEPQAGSGSLVDALIRSIDLSEIASKGLHIEITAVEVDERRARILRRRFHKDNLPAHLTVRIIRQDFLEFARDAERRREQFNVIIANPPFSIAGDREAWKTHLNAMIRLLAKRNALACVLPGSAGQARNGKYDLDLLEMLGKCEIWRNGQGAFKEAGTAIDTMTIVARDLKDPWPPWDGQSLYIENTLALIKELKAAFKLHWRETQMSEALKSVVIKALAEAVLKGGERVTFGDHALAKFREHFLMCFGDEG
jgi:hypothetical protein